MGHARLIAAALEREPPGSVPLSIVELGAGDGSLLLRVAARLRNERRPVNALLVDRAPLLSASTRAGFHARGWQVESVASDIFEWLSARETCGADVMLANLFLHHFDDGAVRELFDAAARQTRCFVACEPLRARMSLAAIPFMRLMGCNTVTLHDGEVSVRAGFRGAELGALWPRSSKWHIDERRAGLFTHFFAARASMPHLA